MTHVFARYVSGKRAGTLAERDRVCRCGEGFKQNVISKDWRERNPDYEQLCEVEQHKSRQVWWFPRHCSHCARRKIDADASVT